MPPPARRTALWQKLTASADDDHLVLPVCRDCANVQYPPRELCRRCLSDRLQWQTVDANGEVLSWTLLHASVEPFFQQHLPWRIGSIKLKSGPVVIVHLAINDCSTGQRVQVINRRDPSATGVLIAISHDKEANDMRMLGVLLGDDRGHGAGSGGEQ